MTFQITKAQVEQIRPLTDNIIQLVLHPEHYIEYIAGQYLEIQSEEHFLAYSIANAPLGSRRYELHIRHQGNFYEQPIFSQIKKQGELTIRLPFGDCHIQNLEPDMPIIFVAGGTGFAPVKAMIEELLVSNKKRLFELFWGARSQSDLYLDNQVRHWQSHVINFNYYSLTSTANVKETLTSLLMEHHPNDLNDYQIVISGPFDMVYATRDTLTANQFNPKYLFSDAFSFEKKE